MTRAEAGQSLHPDTTSPKEVPLRALRTQTTQRLEAQIREHGYVSASYLEEVGEYIEMASVSLVSAGRLIEADISEEGTNITVSSDGHVESFLIVGGRTFLVPPYKRGQTLFEALDDPESRIKPLGSRAERGLLRLIAEAEVDQGKTRLNFETIRRGMPPDTMIFWAKEWLSKPEIPVALPFMLTK
jgi:hypothetical protein